MTPQVTITDLPNYVSTWSFKLADNKYISLSVFWQPDGSVKYGIINDWDYTFDKKDKQFIYTSLPSSRSDSFWRDCRYKTLKKALLDVNYIINEVNLAYAKNN